MNCSRENERCERAGDRLREHRLPDAREVLDDQVALGEHAEDTELERLARRAHRALQVLDHALDDAGRRPRYDRPLRASGVRHVSESSRSTSSSTAAATTRFGAFATWRSPFAETTHDLVLRRVEADVGARDVVEDEEVGVLGSALLARPLEAGLGLVGREARR